jgi:hypothetical protein
MLSAIASKLNHFRAFPGLLSGAVLLWVAVACSDATGPTPEPDADLLVRLNALPGVVARKIDPFYGYPRAFELDITQPVDHDNPAGPTFTQRAYLSHVNDSTPMVFAASG